MLQINSLNDDLESEKTLSKSRTSSNGHEAVITQMTSGVRDSNRVNIYINNKFSLSLDVKQVVDLQLKVGKVISEGELQNLHSASEFGKLYQRALEWALTRPRSRWETHDYLKRCQLKRLQLNKKRTRDGLKALLEIQDSTISMVLERLSDRGYVDDQKFAEFYIENRFVKKGVSKRRLEMELHKKHIPDYIIIDALAKSSRNENEELTKMIVKKSKKYDPPKLMQYLLGQGFDYESVKNAIEKLHDETNE